MRKKLNLAAVLTFVVTIAIVYARVRFMGFSAGS
jgi:hypothetical protein